MAKYISIASGSKGNCGLLVTKTKKILIDIGISSKKVSEVLACNEIDDVDCILISHEHSDHIKGLAVFSKKSNAKIYITRESFLKYPKNDEVDLEKVVFFQENDIIFIDDIKIITMKTPHDSETSVGFKIETDDIIYSHVTDLGYMPMNILNEISMSNAVTIECNYDKKMLEVGKYPHHLKLRIKSNEGHLSNEESLKCVAHLLQSGVNDIVLAHLSEENNSKFLLKEQIKDLIEIYSVKKTQKIHIATQNYENLSIDIEREKICLQ